MFDEIIVKKIRKTHISVAASEAPVTILGFIIVLMRQNTLFLSQSATGNLHVSWYCYLCRPVSKGASDKVNVSAFEMISQQRL